MAAVLVPSFAANPGALPWPLVTRARETRTCGGQWRTRRTTGFVRKASIGHGGDAAGRTKVSAVRGTAPDQTAPVEVVRDRRRVTRLLELLHPDDDPARVYVSADPGMDNMRLERYSASTEAAKSDVLRLHMAEIDALLYALEQAYARRAPFIAQQSMLEAAVGAYTLLFVRTHAPLVGATALTTSLAHRRRRLLAVFQRAAVRDFLANVAVLGWLKRSRPARILFTVTNRLQVLHSKRFLINMLRFRLLRLFTGCITTRARMYFGQSREGKGWSESVAEQSGPVLPSHSVKIKFDAPRISLGRAFSISYGRASEVDMRVTYLDDRLRLMRGPHEELYVFVRVRPGSDLFRLAQEWRAHLAAPTMHPRVALVGALLFAIGCFCVTWTFADMQVALLLTAIFALVSLSLRKEGMSL